MTRQLSEAVSSGSGNFMLQYICHFFFSSLPRLDYFGCSKLTWLPFWNFSLKTLCRWLSVVELYSNDHWSHQRVLFFEHLDNVIVYSSFFPSSLPSFPNVLCSTEFSPMHQHAAWMGKFTFPEVSPSLVPFSFYQPFIATIFNIVSLDGFLRA